MTRCLNAMPCELAGGAGRRRTMPRIGSTAFLVGLAAITLAGVGLRAAFMDHPMRYDESLNYYQFTARSPEYILTHYNPGNHVLHTLMVRVASKLFGPTPAVLRLPVFVGGTLLIPLTALLAWSLTRDRWTALLAALAAAVSSQLVEYSTNARGYVWLGVWSTAALVAALAALRQPLRMRRWCAWGVLAGLGAYTMPLMVYPAAGTLAALVVIALRRGWQTQRGRATLRGALIAAGVCGVVTACLYAPILVTMGPREAWEIREMTVKVWGPRVGGFGNVLALAWAAWTRSGSWWWPAAVGVGAVGFIGYTLRRPTAGRVLVLLTLVGAVVAVRVHHVPLQDRAWMFALPAFLVCAVTGLGRMARGAGRAWGARAALAALCVVAGAELAVARDVARQTYLCSEPDVQVDIREIIGAWRAGGPEQSALLMRYTPAANYYRDLWRLPDPPEVTAEETQRVFIVADEVKPLAGLWNSATEGQARFGPPRELRRLARCTVYVAERIR